MKSMIKTFLSQIGSPREIAEQLEAISGRTCTTVAVYQWPSDDKISEKWLPWLARIAKKKKLKNIPPEVRRFM